MQCERTNGDEGRMINMDAKFRRRNRKPAADTQSSTSVRRWPETVERRIGLDVRDGQMGVAVIDGEVVDASSSLASMDDQTSEQHDSPMIDHPLRRFRRLRRLNQARSSPRGRRRRETRR
jgi:hypothetical protein